MFWSHDLLGKKTALGAVWIAAHGKKLNKGRILQVSVTEACKKVMDPEVPQALRLQAILVGGIVIVHARQQVYLLEDAQKTLRRMRALDTGEAGTAGAAGAPRAVLGEGKRAAKEEAITLPLYADMQFMNLGELFPSFPTQALSEGGGASGRAGMDVGDGLFVMPSLPAGQETSSGGPSQQQQQQQQRRGRGRGVDGVGAGSGGGLMLGADEPELQLEGLPRHDLELMDEPETFAVPDLDLPGMEMFLPAGFGAGAGGRAGSAGAPAELEPPLPDDLVPVPSALLGGEEAPQEGHPEVQQEVPSTQTPQSSAERSGGAKGGATPRTRRRGGLRRSRPTIDDIDTLLIRGRDYRDWVSDRSNLLVPRPLRAPEAAPARAPFTATPATAAFMPGGGWPAELRELFVHCATLPSPAGQAGARNGRGKGKSATALGEQPDLLEEQEGMLDGERGAGSGGPFRFGAGAGAESPVAPGGPFGLPEEGGFGGLGEFGFQEYGYREEPAPPEVEVGFGGDNGGAGPSGSRRQYSRGSAEGEEEDVETERLRAALNSTQGIEPFFPLGLTPGSAGGSLLATGRGARGKRPSSLLRRDSESGVLSERSTDRRDGGRLSDLPEAGPLGGTDGADLGAMLPAVGEDEPFLEEEQEEREGGEGGSRRKRRRTGESEGQLTGTEGLTQFELLEASGPTQLLGPLPGAAPGEHLNRQTQAFISVMRGRFAAAEEGQQGKAGGASQEAGCQLSLFGMAERLSRMDAAKLFYQVLVTRSAGFLDMDQEEPFGDIQLSRGAHL